MKNMWDMQRNEESKQEYKDRRREAKRCSQRSSTRRMTRGLYEGLDTKEGEQILYRLARHRNRAGKDVQQVRMMKNKERLKGNDRREERI